MAMKKNLSVPLLILVSIIIITLGSCVAEPPAIKDYLIQVDSIHVPETINASVPFYIEFYGVVGFDGCHSFENFNLTYKNSDIYIETWGKFDNKAGACPDVVVMLNGQKLNTTIAFPGTYTLFIVEPYGYDLVKQIVVR